MTIRDQKEFSYWDNVPAQQSKGRAATMALAQIDDEQHEVVSAVLSLIPAPSEAEAPMALRVVHGLDGVHGPARLSSPYRGYAPDEGLHLYREGWAPTERFVLPPASMRRALDGIDAPDPCWDERPHIWYTQEVRDFQDDGRIEYGVGLYCVRCELREKFRLVVPQLELISGKKDGCTQVDGIGA